MGNTAKLLLNRMAKGIQLQRLCSSLLVVGARPDIIFGLVVVQRIAWSIIIAVTPAIVRLAAANNGGHFFES